MKRRIIELGMAVLLLLGVFLLSKEGAVLTSKETEEKQVILVDAGHGGADPGVIGVNKLKEKDINLKIAKELKKLLEKEGFEVVMTRTSDKGLYDEDTNNKKVQDMQRRCFLIKETKPILSVSIHQNSYQQESVCGPQVFYYTQSTQGAALAKCIQDKLNTQMEVTKNRVEKANNTYYLLKKSEGVLTIVETGFLTNRAEAALLEKKEYQKKAAMAIRDGILEYLSMEPQESTQKTVTAS